MINLEMMINLVMNILQQKIKLKRSHVRVIRSVWFNKQSQPEKHYRKLIMLFTAWRNEGNDLIGKYSSYKEQYLAIENEIFEQTRECAVCA